MNTIVKKEKENMKELIDERQMINKNILRIEMEKLTLERGIKLLKPQAEATEDIYQALDDSTSKNNRDEVQGQLSDAYTKLEALKNEFEDAERRLTEIDRASSGKENKINLGEYLLLSERLLKLQIGSYKKQKDLSSEIKPLVSSLKDSNMLHAGAILIGRLNRGIV